MTKTFQLGGMEVPYAYTHLGGTTVAPNGTAILLTPPTGAAMVYIAAEATAAYYNVGTTTASVSANGYVPVNTKDMVFPIDNLTNLSVFTPSGGTIHIQYYTG